MWFYTFSLFLLILRVGGVLIPTRSFGDFLLKSEMDKPAWKQVISVVPQIVAHPLNASWDFLVVASDGVWDAVTNRELVAIVRDGISGGDGSEKKVTLALTSGCINY